MLGDIKRPQTHWLEWLFEAWWRPGNMATVMESAQQLMQGNPWVLGMLNWKGTAGFLPAFPDTHCVDAIKGQSSQGLGCLFPPLLKALTLVTGCTIKIIPSPSHHAWSFYNSLWAVFYPYFYKKPTQEMKAVEDRGDNRVAEKVGKVLGQEDGVVESWVERRMEWPCSPGPWSGACGSGRPGQRASGPQ